VSPCCRCRLSCFLTSCFPFCVYIYWVRCPLYNNNQPISPHFPVSYSSVRQQHVLSQATGIRGDRLQFFIIPLPQFIVTRPIRYPSPTGSRGVRSHLPSCLSPPRFSLHNCLQRALIGGRRVPVRPFQFCPKLQSRGRIIRTPDIRPPHIEAWCWIPNSFLPTPKKKRRRLVFFGPF
jgi:hypothetical protein